MIWQLNQIEKECVITKKSYGAVIKAGMVYEHNTNKRRKLEPYTIIKVLEFDFNIKRVVIECTKGVTNFKADVDVNFLMKHCALETQDANREVDAVMIQHVSHNLLDKDTIIFIFVMILTYLVGLVLGKGV